MDEEDQILNLEWMRIAAASQSKPVWWGDLTDDCTARWAGLTLRAECMDESVWWWAVYLDAQDLEIASSNDLGTTVPTGEDARNAAEQAARAFLQLHGNT